MRTRARMTNIDAAACVVMLVLVAAAARGEHSAPVAPEDLAAVIALLRTGDATALQKQQLYGKWYTGTVTVKDVLGDGTGAKSPAKIIVEVKGGSRGNDDNFVEFAFEIADIAAAAKLRKGNQVLVTGKLVGMSIRPTTYHGIGAVEVFTFRDVRIGGASSGASRHAEASSTGQKILDDATFFTEAFRGEIKRLLEISTTEGDIGLRVRAAQPTAPAISDIVRKYGPPDKTFDDRLPGPPPPIGKAEEVTVHQYDHVKLAVPKAPKAGEDGKVIWVDVRDSG